MTYLLRDLVLKWIDEQLEYWHFRGASALITLKDLRVAIAQGALSPSPAGQEGLLANKDEPWQGLSGDLQSEAKRAVIYRGLGICSLEEKEFLEQLERLYWDGFKAGNTRSPGGWLPIETAPRDGTRIILDWDGSRVGFYLDNSKTKYPWEGWRVPSGEVTPKGQPKGWQPLPPPPTHEARHEQ